LQARTFLSASFQCGQGLAQSPNAFLDALLALVGKVQAECVLAASIGMESFSCDKGHSPLRCLG
jgi:hypothetical protein